MESRKHDAAKLLRTVPLLGRAYCGLALETRSSADYRFEDGQLVRAKKPVFIRGLNRNHNHDLKNLFKSAATTASVIHGPFREFYEGLLAKGMQPAMARLTLARKIAAITLSVWKKGESFDPEQLKPQAAYAFRAQGLCQFHAGVAFLPAAERTGSRVSILGGLGNESHGPPYAPSDNPTKL